MKRKNKGMATCIFSSDWHIRGDRPVCRTDDYMLHQGRKLEVIFQLAVKHQCPILVAGDLGHRPMWGDKLLNWFMDKYVSSVQMIITCGQHDLPHHRLDKWKEAGVGVLSKKAENFKVEHVAQYLNSELIRLACFPYGENIKPIKKSRGKAIALMHRMVIKSQKRKLWPEQRAHSAKWFLKKYPCYDVIVSGDNHQSFVVEHEGRLLVNPGSIMRMSANQIAHKPSVYLYYAETNSVERVYLPAIEGVINREHIEENEQRNERIDAFVSSLNEMQELGLSYEKNMEHFLNTNKVKKRIKKKIWEALK